MSDVRRDNTGAGRFDEGLALPTTAFPSDHAIVSAAVRLRPAAALGAHTAAAEDVAAACIEAGEVRDKTAAALDGNGTTAGISGGTLYDYWGIAELPPALSQVASVLSAAEDGAAGVGARCGKPDGRRRPRRGSRAEDLELQMFGPGDRAVWVLFSPRPMSAALCQPWFVALLAALAVAPLLDAIACCRAVLRPPPAPAGRAFRFAPTDPRHAFLPPGHGGGGVCWRPSQSSGCGAAGAVLAAETAQLLLGGRDAPGAAAATVTVSADGAAVLMLPPGRAVAADGLACDALWYPASAAVDLQAQRSHSLIHVPCELLVCW